MKVIRLSQLSTCHCSNFLALNFKTDVESIIKSEIFRAANVSWLLNISFLAETD